jgi:hypothetical protein
LCPRERQGGNTRESYITKSQTVLGWRTRKDEERGAWPRMRKEKYITQGLFLLGKPEGNRPLGRPRRRRKDNIKVNI